MGKPTRNPFLSDSRGGEMVTIPDVRCMVATDSSMLCRIDGADYWIPRSQVDESSEIEELGDEGNLTIPEWLAVDRGLV